jgi:pimeloyl-ACP methyl ester carboxylesterase
MTGSGWTRRRRLSDRPRRARDAAGAPLDARMSTVERTSVVSGWEVVGNAPAHERHRVLLAPGLFCTAAFFGEMLGEGSLDEAGVKALATTPPGFGGNPLPDGFDCSIESYAQLYESFAAAQAVDLIVGHSFSANVCIEIAARGNFTGRLMLLSPSLQAGDEEENLRQLYQVGKTPVVGGLVWLWLPTSFKKSFKGELPEAHYDELIAEMRRNPRHASRRQVNGFFAHLEEYGSIAGLLTGARATTWLVRGDRDPIQDTDEEVAILQAAPLVERKTVPDAAHFSITDNPAAVNRLIIELLTEGSQA